MYLYDTMDKQPYSLYITRPCTAYRGFKPIQYL